MTHGRPTIPIPCTQWVAYAAWRVAADCPTIRIQRRGSPTPRSWPLAKIRSLLAPRTQFLLPTQPMTRRRFWALSSTAGSRTYRALSKPALRGGSEPDGSLTGNSLLDDGRAAAQAAWSFDALSRLMSDIEWTPIRGTRARLWPVRARPIHSASPFRGNRIPRIAGHSWCLRRLGHGLKKSEGSAVFTKPESAFRFSAHQIAIVGT